LQETKDYILPYAQAVNNDMFIELSDLVESREKMFHLLSREVNSESNIIQEKPVSEKNLTLLQWLKTLIKLQK
jgi:hypothetical protein